MVFHLSGALDYAIGNNLVRDYLFAAGILVLSAVILKVVEKIVIYRIKGLAAKTKTEIDDLIVEMLEKIGWPAYSTVGLFIAAQFLTLPNIVDTSLYFLALVVVTYYIVKSIQRVIDFSTRKMIQKREREVKDADTSIIDFLSRFLKGILWLIAVLLILSNMGYNITTLVAGLGIGGVAIAIALQSVLGDVFSAFTIYFDKPFQVGDFIIIGDDMGVVQRIGIKSTRIQTLQGEELVVSNNDLTSTRIHNYKKMKKRRVVFSFGVTYDTPVKKLKKIPKIVMDIIGKTELAEINRVHFKSFGDFSLIYEVVYYVDTGDYNKYMDTQQGINVALKERFEKEKIEFAFPTQTVYVSKMK